MGRLESLSSPSRAKPRSGTMGGVKKNSNARQLCDCQSAVYFLSQRSGRKKHTEPSLANTRRTAPGRTGAAARVRRSKSKGVRGRAEGGAESGSRECKKGK